MGEIFSPSKKTATCQTCLCAFKAHTETLATECRVSDEVIYNTALFSSKCLLTTALRVLLYYLFIYLYFFISCFPHMRYSALCKYFRRNNTKKKNQKMGAA